MGEEGRGQWGGGGKGSIFVSCFLFLVVQFCLGAFAVSKQAASLD